MFGAPPVATTMAAGGGGGGGGGANALVAPTAPIVADGDQNLAPALQLLRAWVPPAAQWIPQTGFVEDCEQSLLSAVDGAFATARRVLGGSGGGGDTRGVGAPGADTTDATTDGDGAQVQALHARQQLAHEVRQLTVQADAQRQALLRQTHALEAELQVRLTASQQTHTASHILLLLVVVWRELTFGMAVELTFGLRRSCVPSSRAPPTTATTPATVLTATAWRGCLKG